MNKIYPLTNEYEKIEYDHGPGGTTEYKKYIYHHYIVKLLFNFLCFTESLVR